MKLSPAERETIILFSDADDTASVYTYDRRLIKKLDALCRKCPEEVYEEKTRSSAGAKSYIVPKSCVSVREPFYGMIDGIINNGPREQPEVKPKAPDLSALFEAARQVVQEDKQAPEPGKKPSVLAMLHVPAPSRSEKTAQTKSAERDLI